MDSTMLAIRAYLPEPVDPQLLQTCVELSKGETSSICQILRHCLAAPRFRILAGYLKRQGYVLTLSAETKFLDTVQRVLINECDYCCKITLEELFAPGHMERKREFVLEALTMCAKRNDELEKLEGNHREVSSFSPHQSRRRSYSAGAEQLKISSPTLPIRAKKIDIDTGHHDGRSLGIKLPRPVYNGPLMTETWVTSPPHTLQHPQAPPVRNGYYARAPSLTTPPSVMHAAHLLNGASAATRENDDNGTNGNGFRQSTSPGMTTSMATIGSTTKSQALAFRGSSLITDEEHAQPTPLTLSTIARSGSDISLSSLSPRERVPSPHRKATLAPSASTTYSTVAPLRGRRRLDLEEEPGSATKLPAESEVRSVSGPTHAFASQSSTLASSTPQIPNANGSGPGMIMSGTAADRIGLLESRIESELATMNERFSRLESTINELARLLIMQAKNEPSKLANNGGI